QAAEHQRLQKRVERWLGIRRVVIATRVRSAARLGHGVHRNRVLTDNHQCNDIEPTSPYLAPAAAGERSPCRCAASAWRVRGRNRVYQLLPLTRTEVAFATSIRPLPRRPAERFWVTGSCYYFATSSSRDTKGSARFRGSSFKVLIRTCLRSSRRR